MTALCDRVLGAPAGHDTGRMALGALADRALAAPAGPPLHARRHRGRLLRQAIVLGAQERAAGGDVVELAAAFQALRAAIRGRRRRPVDLPVGVGSPGSDGPVDTLLDDVLVALVRGYEASPAPDRPLASTGAGGAVRSAAAHPIGASRRE